MAPSALPPPEELDLEPLADIARGGMGVVQMARVRTGRLEGRVVAVKRLAPSLELEPEFVNMFLDETWITAGIDSPHVVKVEAWGRDALGLFLAVELVQGVSLSRLIKESKAQQEPFAERTVANIVSQVCSGLGAAHNLRSADGAPLRLVHRDLTPGNILVGFDGVVKLADFGIAKAEERLTSTRIGMMKGKPSYMAPEQARGGEIDARADLFSVGVVLYELLAGQRPWVGRNDLETLIAVSTKEPADLASIRRTNPVFHRVTHECLQKDPAQRPPRADEIRAALDRWRVECGFARDDRESLSAFVQRNTQEQQTWFGQALGGTLSRGVTYMDVENRIDARRTSVGESTSGSGATNDPAIATATAPGAGALDEYDENAATRFLGAGGEPMRPMRSEPTRAVGGTSGAESAQGRTATGLGGTVVVEHAEPSAPKPVEVAAVRGRSATAGHGTQKLSAFAFGTAPMGLAAPPPPAAGAFAIPGLAPPQSATPAASTSPAVPTPLPVPSPGAVPAMPAHAIREPAALVTASEPRAMPLEAPTSADLPRTRWRGAWLVAAILLAAAIVVLVVVGMRG